MLNDILVRLKKLAESSIENGEYQVAAEIYMALLDRVLDRRIIVEKEDNDD